MGCAQLRFGVIGFFLHAPVADTWFTLLEAVGPPTWFLPVCKWARQRYGTETLTLCRLCTQRSPPGERSTLAYSVTDVLEVTCRWADMLIAL